MLRLALLGALALSASLPAPAAELRFHSLFSDNMVLQRDQAVAIYGNADPGESVSVKFEKQEASAVADAQGRWMLELKAMAASFKPATLSLSSKSRLDTVSLKNVLVGDVWVCSGQSNMERPIREYSLLKPMLEKSKHPELRILVVRRHEAMLPEAEPSFEHAFGGGWSLCQGEALLDSSPAAHFFGLKMERDLKVPIGLLESGVGGTPIEFWLPRETFDALEPSQPCPYDFRARPGFLYNSMIHPLTGFTVKGILWYQGEASALTPQRYAHSFPALIGAYRQAWGLGELPFYFVQLAPSPRNPDGDRSNESWAWLREAQAQGLALTNTGMVVTTDLGEEGDIHPQNKQPVGERLALLAERGMGLDVEALSPSLESAAFDGSKVSLRFVNVGQGLRCQRVAMNRRPNLPWGEDPDAAVAEASTVSGFTLCGADAKFYPAQARITARDLVELSSVDVPSPTAVRYAWQNFPLCNLFNSAGLPAKPFRTDHFSAPEFLK
jgi:sialate O-acetylesterase